MAYGTLSACPLAARLAVHPQLLFSCPARELYSPSNGLQTHLHCILLIAAYASPGSIAKALMASVLLQFLHWRNPTTAPHHLRGYTPLRPAAVLPSRSCCRYTPLPPGVRTAASLLQQTRAHPLWL
jgi:hypothetical protein